MICNINNIKYTDKNSFFLIAGPCVIENDKMPFEIAEKINHICNSHKVPFIFKASYRKANRSKSDSFTGIGDLKGLKIIQEVGKSLKIPVLTDIHSTEEATIAARYVDVLQIPAFLCRQTELLVAAAKTGKTVNIKKGQFLSAESMKFAVEKVRQAGNKNIMLTERGSMFGYQDLIVDFRNIPIMQKNKVPVVLDVTHSLQQPNQSEGVTGGKPEMIECMAKAGIATGVDGIFIETHPSPALAKSDGANMLKLDKLEDLLIKLLKVRKAII
ncbi:MAG: 3-deoxy-8-phosphooctulonate synthase [Bacteroidales bacterium]|nr:3-deoxy-8-phosphooctulonate synthase [Bacteroidales bacterium]